MKKIIKKFIPQWLLNLYHFILAFFGALIYRFPSRRLKLIGVTGTNGKTTVVEMITKILEEGNHKIASLDSIKFKIGGKEWLNELRMTMPGRFSLQRFLRRAVTSGCQYAVLEVTSEGIKQYRHKFIDFEAAILTNLAPEHIEAHGGFENYKKTKGKLFQAAKNIHIINIDDNEADYFLKFPAKKKYGYGFKIFNFQFSIFNKFSNSNFQKIVAENPQVSNEGVSFSFNNLKFNLKLLGEFNIYNALAAICVGLSQGISLEICKSALEKIEGIPGRMELVISKPIKVFVDYAFTPNALEKVYQTLTHQLINSSTHQLICVLGACGGGRDKWKRPVLGEIAAKYCQEIIITNEDPYDENPLKIMEDIESGFSQIPNSKFQITKYEKILDRREAIRKSLHLAKPNDIVVITGKGCEPSICVAGGKKIPWDDRKVVREEFKNLNIPHFLRS